LKTYFKGLNGLRFIGAFSVILGHIELIKSFYGIPNLMYLPFFKNTNGHLGVLLFFVLSGFLITYFLIAEIQTHKKINYKIFYLKRVLRIWPIYYLMVLFSIFILPTILTFLGQTMDGYTFASIKYYLLFLPNIAKSLHYSIPGAVHLWSIGVEEQFYLVWPILIFIFRKKLLLFFLFIFISFSVLPMFIDYVYVRVDFLHKYNDLKLFLNSFSSSFKINSMALGGIFAYLHVTGYKHLIILHNKFVEIILIPSTFISWIFGVHLGAFSDEIYSILFAFIIYIVATKNNPTFNLENKLFNLLGKISYGLYVYHWVIFMILIQTIKNTGINFYEDQMIVNSLIYIVGISSTIVISYLSFKYIEEPIVNLKNKLK
jgi:peptidoglycan/LPS O-acetylase OafA/YrhL